MTGLLCSGALLVSALPVSAFAASGGLAVTGQDSLVLDRESVLTVDLGDPTFNGTKTITLSGYTEPIPEEYVTDGLVLRLDGLEGTDSEAGTWTNLADPSETVEINRADKAEGEGENSFQDDGLWLDNSKIFLPESAAQAINGTEYTVEYFVDKEGYSGYETAYSPLLTVDESGDSWSIFTRTAGETMELKQGPNSTRLRTDFDDALGAPSAIVLDYDEGVCTWYLDGEEKASFAPGGLAEAEDIILGGRLGGANYQTQAQYYSIRIYDRALSQEELAANAALDRSRFLGEDEAQVPDLTFDGVALESDGETEVELTFVDGVAELPVVSGALGAQSLTLAVDGEELSLELQTQDLLDATLNAVPDALTVEVSASATDSDIRSELARQIEGALADTAFLTEGGSVQVTGSEDSGFQAQLRLDGDTASKELDVTVERGEATDADALAPYFQTVMQGTFDFESAEAVTAEAIQEQAAALLGDETVSAEAAWDEESGCWLLTLEQDGKSAQMPLYINSEVELTFDDASLMNYTTTRMAGSDTAYISGGALHVTGTTGNTYENVVLPVWNFGRDVCIEAEVRMVSAVNDSRWMALSYGVKPNSAGVEDAFTFRQMAVRQNATASNGVEFAMMTDGASPAWNVTHTGSYSEALDPEKTYKFTVIYRDGNVYEYIDDQLIIRAEDVPQEQIDGKIAFSFDRLTAEMTSLRVTSDLPDLPTELPMTENGYETEIYEPETGLVMSPTVVSLEATAAADVAAAERRPATLVRELNADLTVEDGGETIALDEFLARLDKKALPGLRIEDMATAQAFAQYVEENGVVDVNVLSSDGEVLKTACAGAPGIRGMLDFSAGMPDELIDVVFDTNRSNARVAIIPVEAATQDNVAYIQARAVTVWVYTDSRHLDEAILAGADGLVVDGSAAALDAIEAFDPAEPVVTRRTVIVAHRGLHQEAPENTERAAALAVEAGADAIECDVYLTADGEIVINHDDTTGRLMNENLTVADSTLAELQALTFSQDPNAQEGDRIPTLQQLFDAADAADPDDDVIHVIEIKHTDPDLIKPLADAIRAAGMEDRVVFISFSYEQLQLIRQEMPEISVGGLNVHSMGNYTVAENLESISENLDPLNAFYNCYYGYGVQSPELVAAARHRGIYVHPWTVDDQTEFENEYANGYHGITSNYVDYATDYLTGVSVEGETFTAATGMENAVTIPAQRETRGGSAALEQPKVLQLSGVTVSQTESGALWAGEAGEAVVALGDSYTLPATGRTYTQLPPAIRNGGMRYGILSNGAVIMDLLEKRPVWSGGIPVSTVLRLLKGVEPWDPIFDVFVDGCVFTEKRNLERLDDFGLPDSVKRLVLRTRYPVDDMEQFLRNLGTDKIPERLNLYCLEREPVCRYLESQAGLTVTTSLGGNVEVTGAGVGKAEALKTLAGLLEIPMEQTAAVGDNENDLTMIQAAGLGIAMGDGSREVRLAADWVTGTNREDGAAAALEKILCGSPFT